MLYSCGDDIDAAVRRLSELRLRPDGTAVLLGEGENGGKAGAAAAAAAAASGRATPELVPPSGPGSESAARSGAASPGPGPAAAAAGGADAAERKSASVENNTSSSADPSSAPAAAAASAPPAEVDAWAEGLVGEMAAASDVGDARSRAATVLRGFESALLHRVASAAAAESSSSSGGIASAAATAARAAALERDCSLLKRAVALQASRLQGAAQQRQQETLALTRALQEARARVQQLEMTNFALAAHLRAATEGSLLGGVGGGNGGDNGGGGGGGHLGLGGPRGGFASPSRDVY